VRAATLPPGLDPGPLLFATATAAGALAARPLPLGVVAAAVAVAAVRPRRTTVAVALLVLASWLGARSWAGLEPPAAAPVDGWATLLTDPDRRDGALHVEARVGGRRVDAWVRGAPAVALEPRLAGERVHLRGRVAPLPPASRTRLAARHISARLTVVEVEGWKPGGRLARVANGFRRLLDRGAASLPPADRALYSGVVFGDDRAQDDGTVADFRASGLTHLLAVSGQNVAFALAVARPLLERLPLRRRLLAALGVLVLFGTVTRWEPSVTRASAMAALAVTATTFGRRVSAGRLLALAVAGLLLVDPLLVHALGFRLSVAACAGIAALSRPAAAALPSGLPGPVREALAVTLAAQAGVAPVLLPTFGSLPLASIPANLLAAPLAGPLMAWGLAAGTVAGVLGGVAAALLHLPTLALTRALGWIAGWGARLPLGQLRPAHVLPLALVAGAVAARRRGLAVATAAAIGMAAALLVAAGGGPSPGAPLAPESLARGARVWRAGGATVLVLDGARPTAVLDGLRAGSIRRVDIAVSVRGSRADAAVLAALEGRVPVRAVLVPAGGQVGGLTPTPGRPIRAGGLTLEVTAVEPILRVRIAAVARSR